MADREINNSFKVIYEENIDHLYSYGISLGFDKEQCMDAIQDVFCKLFINNKEFSSINNIRFYLLKSLKNRLLDIVKKNKRENPESKITISDFPVEISFIESIIDKEERAFIKMRINNLMAQLTPNQREAIYLRYMQELEYDEIAKLLNITPESCRKMVYRAIERLRSRTSLNIALIITLFFQGNF